VHGGVAKYSLAAVVWLEHLCNHEGSPNDTFSCCVNQAGIELLYESMERLQCQMSKCGSQDALGAAGCWADEQLT
jgi:hypothetical protein